MGNVLTRTHRVVMRYRPRRWLSREWKRYDVTVGRSSFHLVGRRGWGVSVYKWTRDGETFSAFPAATCYEEIRAVKKKKSAASTTDAQHLAAVESQVFAKLHPIVAHCSATKYDDGDPRKPGWVTMKTMGSAWVLEAKDPDTCSKLTVVQSTLDDALALLSVLLESEEAPWEIDPWMQAQAAKTKKK